MMSATRRMMRALPSAVSAEVAPPLGNAKACCTAFWGRPCGEVLRVTAGVFSTLAPVSLASASKVSPLARRSTSLAAKAAISLRRSASMAPALTSAFTSSKRFCFSGVTPSTSTQA